MPCNMQRGWSYFLTDVTSTRYWPDCVCVCSEVFDCKYKNGGCLHYCSISEQTAGVVCSCADGYQLDEDGRSCNPSGTNTQTCVTNDISWNAYMIMVFLALPYTVKNYINHWWVTFYRWISQNMSWSHFTWKSKKFIIWALRKYANR